MRTPRAPRFIVLVLLCSSEVSRALAQAPTEASAPVASPDAAMPDAASTPAPAATAPVSTGPRSLADTLQGDAKREYELGRLLYESGDYAGALLRFEHAHELSGDARLLWNAAVCHKALHQYARAVASMRRYLASSSAAIPPTAAASARNFVAAAERLTARLEVSANVPGALVYADGESLGSVPLGPDARLDWGSHQIVLKKADYTDYEQTVTVNGAADVRVVAVLRPVVHEGRVIVRAASGDLISIDGFPRAWGTWEGVLPSGAHALRVSASGFRPRAQQIVVADAQMRGFDITLERAPSSSLPAWVWIAGGTVLAAGAATAGYFIFRPADPRSPTDGSIATVRLNLR